MAQKFNCPNCPWSISPGGSEWNYRFRQFRGQKDRLHAENVGFRNGTQQDLNKMVDMVKFWGVKRSSRCRKWGAKPRRIPTDSQRVSTRQQAIHGTVIFTPDLLTPHTAFPSLPTTVPVFWNVSAHFFYPCAHSVFASSTRCHLNQRKLNIYRATRPPSWENGTWQVPSQLSHSEGLNCQMQVIAVGFDHGLPCRVKNMAQGTQ